MPVKLPSLLPDDSRSKFSSSSPRVTGLPSNRKRSRDADFLAFLSDFLSSRSTDYTRSTDNTTPKTLMSDEDTRESEALVVADFTHDPPETLAVLEAPGVDDDSSRSKKKPCLDDRDPALYLDLYREAGLCLYRLNTAFSLRERNHRRLLGSRGPQASQGGRV